MRIVCPACDAAYDVPDAMLAGGPRVVRCAKCGREWTPSAIPGAAPGAAMGATSVAPLPPDEPEFDTDAEFAPMRARPPLATEPVANGPVANGQVANGPDPLGRHEPRLNPLRPRADGRASARLGTPPPPDLPPARGGARAIVAWALSILVLAAAGGAAVAWRSQVMTAWPPSERVFAALGLT